MALWQQKGFRKAPLLVDTCQVETAVKPIVPATGKDYPVGIDVPVVIAVGPFTIDFLQLTHFSRLKIEQPLITLLMPDREIAIVHQRKEDVLPVVTGTRPCETLTHSHSIENGIHLLAITPRLGVEGYLAEVILLVLIVHWIILLLTGHEI